MYEVKAHWFTSGFTLGLLAGIALFYMYALTPKKKVAVEPIPKIVKYPEEIATSA